MGELYRIGALVIIAHWLAAAKTDEDSCRMAGISRRGSVCGLGIGRAGQAFREDCGEDLMEERTW